MSIESFFIPVLENKRKKSPHPNVHCIMYILLIFYLEPLIIMYTLSMLS